MENASNALIIAGSILIAIIVLSIGVYLVSTYSRVGSAYEQEMSSVELTKFNSKFMAFQDRNDISAQEIVTLKNFVWKYNQENETNIELVLTGAETHALDYVPETTDANKAKNKKTQIEFIKKYSTESDGSGGTKQITFTCGFNKDKGPSGTKINEGVSIPNGKVTKIEFTKNT